MANSLGEILGLHKPGPKRAVRLLSAEVDPVFEDVRNELPRDLLLDSEASSDSVLRHGELPLQIVLEAPRLPRLEQCRDGKKRQI